MSRFRNEMKITHAHAYFQGESKQTEKWFRDPLSRLSIIFSI